MNINDLVTGRLYKCKNELHDSDYEKNEDLAMFLRIHGKNVSVLTVTGVYKLVPIKSLEIPERNYMELFDESTVSNFSSIMKKFFNEYQKYDSIKYSEKSGFKSGKIELTKLNELKDELKKLKLLPAISIAVENYFETYKDFGIKFSSLEDLIIDFAYIPEWEESFNELRGFDFANKATLSPKQIKKYANEALLMHHIYTNLFIKPNFKNIRAEWLDLLLEKLRRYSTSLNMNNQMVATIESIKWQCVIESRKQESAPKVNPLNNNFETQINSKAFNNNFVNNNFESQLNNMPNTQVNNGVVNQFVNNFSSQMNNTISNATDSIMSGIDQINNIANSNNTNKVPSGYTGINFNL